MKKGIIQLVCIFILLIVNKASAQDACQLKNNFPGTARDDGMTFTIGNYGYLGGGCNEDYLCDSDFWKYDAAIDVWTQEANIPGGTRRDGVGFAVDGYGYSVIQSNCMIVQRWATVRNFQLLL